MNKLLLDSAAINFVHARIQYSGPPSCEAPSFRPEKWPFKRGGLLVGLEINKFMFRFILSSGLSKGVKL